MIFTEENNEMSHVLFHCRSCFYYSHDDLYRTRCPCNPRSQPWRPSRGSSGPLHLPHTKEGVTKTAPLGGQLETKLLH